MQREGKYLYSTNPHANWNYPVSVPPGYYSHSEKLPPMMNSMSPSYSIVAEPVFMDHLLIHLEEDIEVTLTNGTLKGKLAGVAVDHLQLNIDKVAYHVRFQHIMFFRKI